MLSCKETARLVSEGLDHNIPFYKKFLIYLHLRACQTCTFYRKQITALRKIFQCYPDPTEDDAEGEALSAETKERLKNLLRK
jgi:hypothetical protein